MEAGGKRWALPGDMATVDADGTITVLGRGSLCINTGGEKVFPDEVEARPEELRRRRRRRRRRRARRALRRTGGGRGATACRVPVDGEALRAQCRGQLAGYKVPRQVVVADAITRSPAGKADYRWAKAFASAKLTGDN